MRLVDVPLSERNSSTEGRSSEGGRGRGPAGGTQATVYQLVQTAKYVFWN